MSKKLMYVEGTDGQIELQDDRLVITRKGFLNMMKHGSGSRREIPLSSVSSVNFKDATLFKPGEIDFDFAGRSQMDHNQNMVRFLKKKQPEFYALKEKVFSIIAMRNKG
jgi:hypothetical protein